MSEFLLNALQNELVRNVAEIRKAGFDVTVKDDLVMLQPRDAITVPLLPAPAIELAGKVKYARKAGAGKATQLCPAIKPDGDVCGGKINRNGTCPRCYAREYAKKNRKTPSAKKA